VKAEFLTLDEVLSLHADQIERYGGRPGIRDVGLLESALAMPQTTYGGRWLHESLPEMAAAYLFHLVQGHAFVDGNKRIGLMTMLVFLGLNSLSLQATSDELVDLVSGVATRRVSKAEVAVFVQQHTRPRKR